MNIVNNSANELAMPTSSPWLVALRRWVARRRIAISNVCFTLLIAFNLAILQTRPNSPWALGEWKSALGLALVVLGLGIRSWSAGTIRKHDSLTTIGPYALVRNPLYVGSFLMMFGFATLLNDTLSLIFVAGPMFVLYWSQVKVEEKYLAGRYPLDWENYANSTPRFIPYKYSSKWRSGWSKAQWLSNREYQAILGSLVGISGIALLCWYWM